MGIEELRRLHTVARATGPSELDDVRDALLTFLDDHNDTYKHFAIPVPAGQDATEAAQIDAILPRVPGLANYASKNETQKLIIRGIFKDIIKGLNEGRVVAKKGSTLVQYNDFASVRASASSSRASAGQSARESARARSTSVHDRPGVPPTPEEEERHRETMRRGSRR